MEDTKEGRERCIRLSARIAKRNAKSLSSLEKIVRCIVGIVIPSTKPAADRKILKFILGRQLVRYLRKNLRIIGPALKGRAGPHFDVK
jgi:hypothetical protein